MYTHWSRDNTRNITKLFAHPKNNKSTMKSNFCRTKWQHERTISYLW